VTVTVPVAVAVKPTEQVPAVRVQLVGVKEPAAPVDVNETVPVGVEAVPGEVSVTVAVHVDATPTTTGEVQETAVAVARRLTTKLVVPLLPVCPASPP
jgi:hypothetical protein